MPATTDFKDYYTVLGASKTVTLKQLSGLTASLPANIILTSILETKTQKQSSKT